MEDAGHDRAPGLHEALLDNGFEPQESESIMIGRARLLDVDVPLPAGVTLRQVTEEDDVRAMAAMQDAVFGDETSDEGAERFSVAWRSGTGWSCGSPKRQDRS